MRFAWGRNKLSDVERRPARRVRPSRVAPVRIQIIGSNSIDILHARDISVTGLSVYVEHRFAGCDIDQPVELVVTLPGRRTFVTRGVIRHVTRQNEPSTYFGVEFSALSSRHRSEIEGFIQESLEDA